MSNPESAQAEKPRVITQDDVKALSRFHDESGHAVSFYFKPGAGPDKERDGMLMNLKAHDIISNDVLRGEKNHGLLRDLDAVLELSEQAVSGQGPVKVVFACHDRGVWQEFTLPSSGRIIRLEAGKRFDVGPLLRLLQDNDTATNSFLPKAVPQKTA
jgi:hypothetical protein